MSRSLRASPGPMCQSQVNASGEKNCHSSLYPYPRTLLCPARAGSDTSGFKAFALHVSPWA